MSISWAVRAPVAESARDIRPLAKRLAEALASEVAQRSGRSAGRPLMDPGDSGAGGRAVTILKALTVFQPWATFIAARVKPLEFRKWDYSARRDLAGLVGQRIAIHASKRPIRRAEVQDILMRLRDGETALLPEALPIAERALTTPGAFPLSAIICTAIIGKPRRVGDIFRGGADSDRLNHHLWGWPLTDVEPVEPMVPWRGAQGFWDWPVGQAA